MFQPADLDVLVFISILLALVLSHLSDFIMIGFVVLLAIFAVSMD